MENKIVMGAITAAIVIIMVAVALVPVINDAAATEDTFINEGYFFMSQLNANDTAVHTIDYTDAQRNIILVDGAPFDMDSIDMSTSIIFATDSFCVRYDKSGDYVRFMQTSGVGGGNPTEEYLKITIESGNVSVKYKYPTSEEIERSMTFTEAYMISLNPTDFVMKKSDAPAYLNSDSTIHASGITAVGSWASYVFTINGTIESYEINCVIGDGTHALPTISNESIVVNENESHEDLYALDKFTFTATDYNGATADCTYSYFVVPYEVTAERSVHATPGQIALYNAIPVMIFVALIVALIGYGIYRNRD